MASDRRRLQLLTDIARTNANKISIVRQISVSPSGETSAQLPAGSMSLLIPSPIAINVQQPVHHCRRLHANASHPHRPVGDRAQLRYVVATTALPLHHFRAGRRRVPERRIVTTAEDEYGQPEMYSSATFNQCRSRNRCVTYGRSLCLTARQDASLHSARTGDRQAGIRSTSQSRTVIIQSGRDR